MVTSLIVGQSVTVDGISYMGVVPNATVYQTPIISSAQVVDALQKLISLGVSVINYSGGYDSGSTYSDYDQALDDKLLQYYGISFVKSAGNKGKGTGNITSPGKAYNSITVGNAMTKSTPSTAVSVPYFMHLESSFREADYLTNKPDLVAPGTKLSYVEEPNDVSSRTGTSFAAPLVAGVVAQLHQAKQTLKTNPVETKAILLAGADYNVISKTLDTLVDSDACEYIWEKCGVGMVNAKNSMDIALANQFYSVSKSIANLYDGMQECLNTLILSNNTKVRIVLVYDNVDDEIDSNTGYGHNMDLHLKYCGRNCASSTLLYNNVEVLEYNILTFDLYDIYAVYTAIDESLSDQTMHVAIAWQISTVSS